MILGPFTATEEFCALVGVEQTLEELAEVVEDAEMMVERLRFPALWTAYEALQVALQDAIESTIILSEGYPLAESFPDGGLPPEVMTPRQVKYLRGLYVKQSSPQVETICQSLRVDGRPCRAWPLWGSAHCRAHASSEEIEAARSLREAREAFHA